jgi:hypothetical protein
VLWGEETDEPPDDLRETLIEGETGSPAKVGVRGNIHVMSTFKFVTALMAASYWIRTDVVE